jgi:hypothetical protein
MKAKNAYRNFVARCRLEGTLMQIIEDIAGLLWFLRAGRKWSGTLSSGAIRIIASKSPSFNPLESVYVRTPCPSF